MSTTSITYRSLAKVSFDNWRNAVDFAFIIAPQSDGVRVSRIAGEWAVEWRALNLQPTYVPTPPGQVAPYWKYPYVITNSN